MKIRLPLLLLAVLSASAYAQSTMPAPPTAQDQVTVSANRSSAPIGETAKTTYTLDAALLHDYPSLTLDESLRQHAGFELFRRAGEPKRLVVLRGFGHYEVYTGDCFRQVMEHTLGWYRQHLPVNHQGATKP